jgi:hypothetical protein
MALARTANPGLDHLALYRATLTAQSSDLATVDVRPDDARLPEMSGIPLRTGVPGAVAQVSPGAILLVGWDDGNPARPFAALWDQGAAVLRLTLNASKVELGGHFSSPADALTNGVVLGKMMCPFTGTTHGAQGGASTKVLAE